jgi:hypothetical protein
MRHSGKDLTALYGVTSPVNTPAYEWHMVSRWEGRLRMQCGHDVYADGWYAVHTETHLTACFICVDQSGDEEE